jgi:hypothetical protein
MATLYSGSVIAPGETVTHGSLADHDNDEPLGLRTSINRISYHGFLLWPECTSNVIAIQEEQEHSVGVHANAFTVDRGMAGEPAVMRAGNDRRSTFRAGEKTAVRTTSPPSAGTAHPPPRDSPQSSHFLPGQQWLAPASAHGDRPWLRGATAVLLL